MPRPARRFALPFGAAAASALCGVGFAAEVGAQGEPPAPPPMRRLSASTVAPAPAEVTPPPGWVDPFAPDEPADAPDEPAAPAEPPVEPAPAPTAEFGPIGADGVPIAVVLFDVEPDPPEPDPVPPQPVPVVPEELVPQEVVPPEPAPAGRASLSLAGPDPVWQPAGRARLDLAAAPVAAPVAEPARVVEPHAEPAPEPVFDPAVMAAPREVVRFDPPAATSEPVTAPEPLPAGTAGPARRVVAALAVAEEPAAAVPVAVAVSVAAAVPASAAVAASAEEVPPLFGRYCPVAVRDRHALVPADPAVTARYGGRAWRFASPVARAAFLLDPDRYRPVADGGDVVLAAAEGFTAPGRVEHAVLYGGRLFLFRGAETRDAFAADPDRFVNCDDPSDGASPTAGPAESR